MASFKGKGRGEGSKKRPSDPRRRRQGQPEMESLENRRLLSGGGVTWHPTNNNYADAQNGPLANLGQAAVTAYQEYLTYEQGGGTGTFTTPLSKTIYFDGTSMGLNVRGSGNFQTFEQSLVSLGMVVTSANTTDEIVEGYVPLNQLPLIASAAQVIGATPDVKPTYKYQGEANNEGGPAELADVAAAKYSLTGAGQKIGVMSDSVDQYPSSGLGLPASVATGDLPNTVQVLNDGPSGSSDEGRAMLENIYDIVPGASLAFASASPVLPNGTVGGELNAAQSILDLANAGSTVITDDVGFSDELFFQDGPLQQAINTVTSNGVEETSAAGNASNSGYLSQFRPVSATVAGIGTGTFMNFDPTGATQTTTLGLQVYATSNPTFEFDEPVVAGGNGITSQLNFYLLNSSGTVVASGTQNNVAAGSPIQMLFDANGAPYSITPGSYSVAIQLVSGPAPAHVEFVETGDGGFHVDPKFGSAGGTYYPSTYGHSAAAATISVGAVPWFNTPAYDPTLAQTSNEPFSAFGPALSEFTPTGAPMTAQTLLKPDISGADGGNTSFFTAGQIIDTTQPPFPDNPPYPGTTSQTTGESATPTNLAQNLPTFFGTSAATEDVAAVIAMMKEANPTLTQSEILTAIDSSALPLNGGTKGAWNVQGGYGFIQATAAIAAAQQLKVTFISPGANQTVTTAPSVITVSFNEPVNFSTVTASDLSVTGPNGAKVTVGTPISVGGSADPTQIQFPITITPAPGTVANGLYQDQFVKGTIRSQSGNALSSAVADQFIVNQTNGPRVASTSFVGRIVNIQFNEAVNPATISPSSVYLFRDNGVNNPNFNPNGIIVSQLPGAVTTYNPSNFTITIDLTGVPQSSLPTDHYGLVVTNAVTDSIGVPLNGSFSGVFPSGTNPEASGGSTFFQDLGIQTVQAPIITYLGLTASSDSGIAGDNNTNDAVPSLIGQVAATFPGTIAGVLIYAEFNGISHSGVAAGGLNLAPGSGGRGFVGTYDVVTTTNSLGQFIINYPAGVTPLPDGLNQVRVVAVGQPDSPPFPGLSSSQTTAFRVDRSQPYVGVVGGGQATTIPQGANINSLSSLTLDIIDPVNPQKLGSPFAVNPNVSIPALNPTVADNVANYALFLVNSDGSLKPYSNYITSATFTSTSNRILSSDPYTGTVTLTFAPGLPTGAYKFLALSSAYGQGLSDAAGNPFAGYSNEPAAGGSQNFELDFNLQPTPTYITSYAALTPDTGSSTGFDTSGVRANYEIPLAGTTPRAPAPPSEFKIDFSNSLDPTANYNNKVELVRSANSSSSQPDGDFGDLGITNTSGFTVVSGITVTLQSQVAGATSGQFGYKNELLITLPAGFTLPADYYRIYIPNSTANPIRDVFGNQLDGEFLGYQNALGTYVDQLPNGTVRGSSALPDLSGDGTPGGAFMTGFVVVPNGDIIYARADALYVPGASSQTPNGSAALPYPTLAAEATNTQANGGDLNSNVNAGTGTFNTLYDYNGDGKFEPSAFYAAQLLNQTTGGPVVIIAEASIPSRDPNTGAVFQKPFVIQAPTGQDGSASIPAMTTLVFDPGTILKMQNATLFVQNQGSALQINGGPNSYQTVTITSYKDSSIGGVTNGNASSTPSPGDYGGIVFRNYDQGTIPGGTAPRTTLFPGQIPITGNPLVDDRLKGPFASTSSPTSQLDAVSGADDIMSYISFLTEKYAGGVVPQNNGTQYDGITLLNSRPTIVNSILADAGSAGSAVAGLSVDVNSLRADDVAQGPLLRNDQFINNGLNGIYIRAQSSSGIAEATNAIVYPSNPSAAGGSANYVLNDPYPYLLTSVLKIGDALVEESGGSQAPASNRLYITPGMLVKFELGSGILVDHDGSLNVGDSTYIKQFDANNSYGPTYAATLANGQPNPLAGQVNPNFVNNSTTLAQVILTSLYDDTATTTFYDSLAKKTVTIVAPLPALDGGAGVNQPSSGNVPAAARWGGVTLYAGSVDVINDADLRYGGGVINTPTGSSTQHVLEINPGDGIGANIMITDNTFTDNTGAPIGLTPNALEAGDAERPLQSGDPFINGNTFANNGLNGVLVEGGTGGNVANLNVNSVWTGSDFTYILENTIVIDGASQFQLAQIARQIANPQNNFATTLKPEQTANTTLTLQSTLPGTVLANGQTIPAPGLPLVVKVFNNGNTPITTTPGTNPAAAIGNSFQGGAGFLVGVDNGVDPTTDSLIDPGALSTLRIVGIGANQATGQARVPVIITSLFNNTVGTTVNGVVNDVAAPNSNRAPSAGDGGVIEFGANSLSSFNLQDPRYGSLIDNADISYMSEIEQQGGGIVYGFDTTGKNTTFTPSYALVNGLPLPVVGIQDQYNQPKQLTISNSNLSNFSIAAFVSTPGYGSLVIPVNYPSTTGITRTTSFLGEPTHTYFVNDTIANMNSTIMAAADAAAVQILTASSDDTSFPSPDLAVFLNDTFYNVIDGIHTYAPAFDFKNLHSEVAILVMDSIFSTVANNAIVLDGDSYGSEVQYNLFYQISGAAGQGTGKLSPFIVQTNNTNNPFGDVITNDQPVNGNPQFRNPAAGNFNLLPNSAAIDLARSELGPTIFGDMLYPAVTVDPTNLSAIPLRNEPGFNAIAGDVNTAGGYYSVYGDASANAFGAYFTSGLATAPFYNDIVTLPGESVGQRGFPDEWIAVTQASGLGTSDPTAASATYAYQPITGQRDQNGNLRVKDPNSSNVGFGSNPFFDLGAFEYIIQNPPVVDSVVTTSSGSTTTSNIYGVGTIAGTNQLPTSIQVTFSQPINPATLTGSSVTLEASGGTGLFNNNPSDKFYNLSGLLSFNSTTDTLTINTSSIFTSAAAANDEYQLILSGTGSAVIKSTDGVALDGYNLNPTTGAQLPLPSGSDQYPGSNFQVTFTIDTHPPALVAGSFKLDPASDSSGGLNITNVTKPTFDGTITDVFPPTNPVLGDTVSIDISSQGDGNFDILNAGTGTTDANGNFKVTLTTPIPQTPNQVGTNGHQGNQGGVYTIVRVRVTDLAGNVSTLLTAPFSTFLAAGATTVLQEDTYHPQITAFSPLGSTVASTNASGQVQVSVTFDKNIKTSTLNANSVLVYRTGGTGSFTTPVAVSIVPGSFTESYSTAAATLGYETVTFLTTSNLPNDQYEVVLKGTGTNAITDLAGNALSGSFSGTFPTGSISTSGDFTSVPFTVYQPSQSHLIYVQAPSVPARATSGVLGSRTNPFPTITAGMTAATIGDDVLVLPGTYREDVNVKPGVRLLSAALTSTATTYTPGSPNQTLIYGVTSTGKALAATNNYIITVYINGFIAGVPTEVSGFSIISPLIGNTVTGTIDPTNVAIEAINSNASIDRNNIVNGGFGVNLATNGANSATSSVFDNVIAGNINGVVLSDDGAPATNASPFMIVNNTIVDNTYGLLNYVTTANKLEAYVLNNIFAANHDLTTSRNGTGIGSNQPNTLGVGYNLFYQNGANNLAASNAVGSFGLFNPANLSSTPDALGNLLGNPYFAQPEDPRPNGDTPGVFFNYANFDLTTQSIAINAANPTSAPATDFLYRSPVKVSGHGFANTGPASIGAYYPNGTSTNPGGTGIAFTGSTATTGTTGSIGTGNGTGNGTGAGTGNSPGGSISASSVTSNSTVSSSIGGGLALGTKQFSVVTTSLSNNGTAYASGSQGGAIAVEQGPSYIDINFSDDINASTLSPSDLLLTGSGLNAANPAKVTSLAWIDDHAVRFFITGGYANSGTVNIAIPAGAITDTSGDTNVAFSDSIQLPSAVLPSPAAPVSQTVAVTPSTLMASVLPVVQPVAAASPVAVASTPAVVHSTKTSTVKAHHVTPVKASNDKHAAAKAVHKAAPAKPAKAAVKVVHKATTAKKK